MSDVTAPDGPRSQQRPSRREARREREEARDGQKIAALIEKNGYVIFQVPAEEGPHGERSVFTYTAGLTAQGQPELLIVSGTSREETRRTTGILDKLATGVMNGTRVVPGPVEVPGLPGLPGLLKATPFAGELALEGAARIYGDAVEVLVLWPQPAMRDDPQGEG